MSGVMPNPPAEFSALAITRSIWFPSTMRETWRATMPRPGDAKISPINRRFIEGETGPPQTNRRGGRYRTENGAHHLTVTAPVIDPGETRGNPPSAFRLLHGGLRRRSLHTSA